MNFPHTSLNAYLVRTWFGGDAAWCSIVEVLRTPTDDGYLAGIEPLADVQFEGVSPEQIWPGLIDQPGMAIVTIADQHTLTTPEWPVLVVSLTDPTVNHPFRCTAQALPDVENNLWLANMSWSEFEDRLDSTGTFRGFA